MKQDQGQAGPSHFGVAREIPKLIGKLKVRHRLPDGRAGWEVPVARISCIDERWHTSSFIPILTQCSKNPCSMSCEITALDSNQRRQVGVDSTKMTT